MQNENINLYKLFKQYSYEEIVQLRHNARDKDEETFYDALAEFILQHNDNDSDSE